jgi:regulatory protein
VNSEARSAALRLLKFRPRSEAELKNRLAEKGFGDETVRAVVEEMRRAGLVGDARFARYAAAQAAVKPVGRRLILNRLRGKGIAPELAEEAVQAATEGKEDLERAREAASRRATALEGLSREAAQRRLFGYLSRRGFSSEIIWKVVRETVHSSTLRQAQGSE